MAFRECYTASETGVTCNIIEFPFSSGFAKSQKQKSIQALHSAIVDTQIAHKDEILEISSKSEEKLGVNLSAFNLSTYTIKYGTKYTVESAFQSGKVFEGDIQYKDIILLDSLSAKRDPRLKESGNLTHFQLFGNRFEANTGTMFYDWLYINVLLKNPELVEGLLKYKAFTDIEFNSKKSMNTQAHGAALFISLKLADIDLAELKDAERFREVTFPFYNKFI